MILYFADRKLNILGQASTKLPEGLTIKDDLKTEDVDTGVNIFECKITYNSDTRKAVEACAEVGNYILRSHNKENEFYTIIDTEFDTHTQEVYIYAEDAGLDLLNEVVGEYAADKAYPISFYIEKFAYDSGFVIMLVISLTLFSVKEIKIKAETNSSKLTKLEVENYENDFKWQSDSNRAPCKRCDTV